MSKVKSQLKLHLEPIVFIIYRIVLRESLNLVSFYACTICFSKVSIIILETIAYEESTIQ